MPSMLAHAINASVFPSARPLRVRPREDIEALFERALA